MIETAYIGPLPLSHIRRVLFIRDGDQGKVHKLRWPEFDRDAYKARLPEWQERSKFASLPLLEQIKINPPTITGAPDNPDLAKNMAEAEKRLKKFRRSHT